VRSRPLSATSLQPKRVQAPMPSKQQDERTKEENYMETWCLVRANDSESKQHCPSDARCSTCSLQSPSDMARRPRTAQHSDQTLPHHLPISMKSVLLEAPHFRTIESCRHVIITNDALAFLVRYHAEYLTARSILQCVSQSGQPRATSIHSLDGRHEDFISALETASGTGQRLMVQWKDQYLSYNECARLRSIPAWRDTLCGGTLFLPDLRHQASATA
jgi:hypothetical protein